MASKINEHAVRISSSVIDSGGDKRKLFGHDKNQKPINPLLKQ